MHSVVNTVEHTSESDAGTGVPQQLPLPLTERLDGSDSKCVDHVFWATGDIFLSEMNTLTITVNTVGVMGKGLALLAKKRFPDVYRKYKSLCQKGRIEVGKPVLCPVPNAMLLDASDPQNILLFPTKKHWRAKSRIEFIEDGLDHLVANYKQWGIKSLALPALGCGLGGLSWKQVGPVVDQAVMQIDIPVKVYLPHEEISLRHHKLGPGTPENK